MKFTPGTEIVELADGMYARLHENLTNAGIIIGDEGVMIIDSLRMPSFARDLKDDVKLITDKPIKYVLDTHAHWDHSWGNEEFPDSTIIGHKNCYLEMTDPDWNSEWRSKITSSNAPWSSEADLVNITPPNLTFETSMSIYIGGRELEILHLGKAHTSGDIFIHVPSEKLVFTGDVIQKERVPYLGDSYPNDWLDTDDRVSELPINKFVSGHGDIGNHDDLMEARAFIHTLVGETKNTIKDGKGKDEAQNQVIDSMTSRFSNWVGFDTMDEKFGDVYTKLTAS